MFGPQRAYRRYPYNITLNGKKIAGAPPPLYRRQGSAASPAQREVEAIHKSKGASASDKDIVEKMPKTSLSQACLHECFFLGWLIHCTKGSLDFRLTNTIESLN